MMNQKRGLTDIKSCPAMENPGRLTTSLKIWRKRKTLVEPRLAKQVLRYRYKVWYMPIDVTVINPTYIRNCSLLQ